ncbi:MAG: hypothetical protein DRR16_21235 [Candidatus Parabeggiatoa sp. nov. 3]|nr:MAG: hypothetical protein DRR00_23725 [Gammaproteobacteria bacterium]RKZ58354.1 MAG: hypothetical protein DRQ99_25580 [Gammaproteobacteria bacterium]RKZ81816.1 MAG: hypothetical protein DRR16_21235 [Gammaproteobacteria bacterium]HEW97743.1 hypothetical protein [Beggiatoa sp.]
MNLNTQTLVNNRKAIIDQVKKELINIKGRNAAWSSSDIERKIQEYKSQINGKYKPYCQVVIYFINKRIGKNA